MLLMFILKSEFRHWEEDANLETKMQMGEGYYKARWYQGIGWIHLHQDRVQLGAFLNTVMHLRFL
jgi:hypothetical protein